VGHDVDVADGLFLAVAVFLLDDVAFFVLVDLMLVVYFSFVYFELGLFFFLLLFLLEVVEAIYYTYCY
jgi:hypothetical protein